MKTLEFIYQETAIHFLVNPMDANVMVNATEMAKLFGKRTDHYLQNEHTKHFIEALKVPDMSGTLDKKIIDNRGRNGLYFDRVLALDFAAWLDINFRVWIFTTMDNIIFGNYQKHWEAHATQEMAKAEMKEIKHKLLTNPTTELAANYFEAERVSKAAQNAKNKAIKNQLKMFS